MNQTILDKLTRFFEASSDATYRRGTIITLANRDPESVSFLMNGAVEQYDISPEGNKITVNIFKPPAFFPMSWAIHRTPNTYFYAALTDVTVKQADPDRVVAFLKDNPDVAFDLLSRVYKGTDALLKRLVLAVSGIASNRLILELLIEAYRFGTDTAEHKKLIDVKQAQLAARSGLARETVSRELHKLEQENILALTKQGIVFDINQLEKKLDFDA